MDLTEENEEEEDDDDDTMGAAPKKEEKQSPPPTGCQERSPTRGGQAQPLPTQTATETTQGHQPTQPGATQEGDAAEIRRHCDALGEAIRGHEAVAREAATRERSRTPPPPQLTKEERVRVAAVTARSSGQR